MAVKPESRLQRRIHKAVKRRFGGRWFKVWGGPFQEAGISDLVGCCKGLFVALEVKRPGHEDEATDIQLEFIGDIRKDGGIAAVVTSPEEAIEVVRRGLQKAGRLPAKASVLLPRSRNSRSVR